MLFLEQRISRIVNELKDCIYSDSEKIMSYKMKEGNAPGGEKADLDTTDWDGFTAGKDRWGGIDRHYWFRIEVEIPQRFDGKPVVFGVKTGREGQWCATNPQFLIYVNGCLVQALDVNHTYITLDNNAVAGQRYMIALNAYAGMKEGMVELDSRLAVLEPEVERLFYNINVPLEVVTLLDSEDKKRIDILGFLNEAVNMLDLRKTFSDSFNKSVKAANEYLEEEFYGKYCRPDDITATCIGHTHIDVAWLWTLAQTREKTARSFSTVLNLMKEYPEYIFMSSQPQLYKFIKEDHPEMYEEIRERVREGRWEPEGAMWLEADCNLSSGESLVRQVLFGTRFFEKEFGIKNKILWLPDVFGYSAALPQILKKSGINYFMTTKISWNEYNKMPYDTFMWEGIDGTRILTHFITTQDFKGSETPASCATTYNGIINASQVMGAWNRYQQKNLNNEVLVAFGYGDGGGGPTKEMLENARRLEKGIPGCPQVKIGKSLDFFKRLEDKVSGNKRLPSWVGELYLEYHRGTYTSMARNKKYNRKSEFLYQDAELISCINSFAAGAAEYPQEKLNSGWETILLNQFHDILPGSSIKEVYEDSKEQYVGVINKGNEILRDAVCGISSKIGLDNLSVVVFNQLSFNRSDIVEFDLPHAFINVEVCSLEGKLMKTQVVDKGPDGAKILFYAEDVPAKGYKAFVLKSTSIQQANGLDSLKVTTGRMENAYFDISLDGSGNITSILDKVNNRQVLKPGERANVMQAFEDKPVRYDAWDINLYYQEKMWEINDVQSIEVIENGPVRGTLRIRKHFFDSELVQDIQVYSSIPRVDFVNRIEWKEKQILLKAAFPVDIHSNTAAYEIQYGNVERPTHWNTSWDAARFEVCAHKWADLSEDGYGVSLLNDCKYGHDIKDGVMRLTLLKSAVSPNVDADRELHEFGYSLYPHAGDWKTADTVNMAYSFNCPMYAKVENAHAGPMPAEFSMVSLDRENIVVEVVKKAEDSGDIIIRVYECFNRRTQAKLSFFKNLTGAWECDLMENDIEKLEPKGNLLEFEIKPYEIKTFKIRV